MTCAILETRGRKAGGHNTPAAIERIANAMKAHHLRIRARPCYCEKCGVKVKRADLERTGGKWVCGFCLNADIEPLRLEDFVYCNRGTMNPILRHKGVWSDGSTSSAPFMVEGLC